MFVLPVVILYDDLLCQFDLKGWNVFIIDSDSHQGKQKKHKKVF